MKSKPQCLPIKRTKPTYRIAILPHSCDDPAVPFNIIPQRRIRKRSPSVSMVSLLTKILAAWDACLLVSFVAWSKTILPLSFQLQNKAERFKIHLHFINFFS
ncbi:hypothetical protein DM01DRAFT_1406873, partial [Hesseltinella vesiculosa]